MRLVFQKLALLSLAAVALVPSACHTAHAADAPKSITPTVDVEVEDRAPDKSFHVARFTLSMIDGRAQLLSHDGEAKYDIGVHTQNTGDPHFSLVLKRAEPGRGGDLDLTSAIPQHAGPRVLVAKIDRADGHLTSVVVQVR